MVSPELYGYVDLYHNRTGHVANRVHKVCHILQVYQLLDQIKKTLVSEKYMAHYDVCICMDIFRSIEIYRYGMLKISEGRTDVVLCIE